MHAVARPRECVLVLLPLYIQCSTSFSMGGVRTSILGFHSATTRGQGPAQPQYFGLFGTSKVVSKRLCPLQIFCYPVHCLPHRLYNLVEDEPVGRRGVQHCIV